MRSSESKSEVGVRKIRLPHAVWEAIDYAAAFARLPAPAPPLTRGRKNVLTNVSNVHAAIYIAGAVAIPVRSIIAEATKGAKPDKMVIQTL